MNRWFGFASAASAIALAAIFAWSNLFAFQTKTAAPAPMLAAAPEAAMDTGAVANESVSSTPQIIIWGQQPAYGMGGGGGDSSLLKTDMGAHGGGPIAVPEQPLATAVSTESPMMSSDLAVTPDPSTLILGLPEAAAEGEALQQNALETRAISQHLPSSTIWMIGLGAGVLIFAVLAILLRRR